MVLLVKFHYNPHLCRDVEPCRRHEVDAKLDCIAMLIMGPWLDPVGEATGLGIGISHACLFMSAKVV